MSPQQLANKLNGRFLGTKFTPSEISILTKNNMAIVYCDVDTLHIVGEDSYEKPLHGSITIFMNEDTYEYDPDGDLYIKIEHQTPDAVWDITTNFVKCAYFDIMWNSKVYCKAAIIKL